MKNCITLLALFLFIFSASAQNPREQFPGRYTPSMTREKVGEALEANDIIPIEYKYLQVWEKSIDYVTVEISATNSGIEMTSLCEGSALSAGQKDILNKADLGSDIKIGIRFKYKDAANDNVGSYNKIKEMSYTVTIVPAIEAQYGGGFAQLAKYFRETVLDKIPAKEPPVQVPGTMVKFAVNEHGDVVEAGIYRSSGFKEIDDLVLAAVLKMPKWSPAINSKGEKVKQEFKLTIPFNRGGC